MSYGFGTTLGTNASTDRIVWSASPATPITPLTTISLWFQQHGTGGGAFGRLFADSSLAHAVLWDGGGLRFDATFGTQQGQWTFAQPSLDVWHHLMISYDMGSDANDPIIYIDDSSVSITETVAPLGTTPSGSPEWYLGNCADSARAWDGLIAEFAKFDTILTAGNAASLAGGQAATFFSPAGNDRYLKLINTAVDEVTAEVATVTGALVDAAHPTITYPSGGARRRDGMLLGLGVG